MTTLPESIGPQQTLAKARELMRDQHIRHLPVLEAGKLVGIVTDRDIALIEALKDVDSRRVLVADAMTTDLFTVSPDAALDEVASEMAEHKYGSALIVDGERVVGIFTTVDACRTLCHLLQTRLR